jgi:hypothetical protein
MVSIEHQIKQLDEDVHMAEALTTIVESERAIEGLRNVARKLDHLSRELLDLVIAARGGIIPQFGS